MCPENVRWTRRAAAGSVAFTCEILYHPLQVFVLIVTSARLLFCLKNRNEAYRYRFELHKQCDLALSSRNREMSLLTIFKIKAEGIKEREESNAVILAITFAMRNGIEGD